MSPPFARVPVSSDLLVPLAGNGYILKCLSMRPSFVRTPWKRCCFSGDGEYIVAGSARQHALYIWEKSIGNLVKILHGTRGELLLDVAVMTRHKELSNI